MKKLNYSLLVILFFFLNFETLNSQEKASKEKKANSDSFISRVGVVDMKRILNQSKAYQSLVDQFEDKRRKQRNIITKQEDQIRDQESELIKQKNVSLSDLFYCN